MIKKSYVEPYTETDESNEMIMNMNSMIRYPIQSYEMKR